MRTCLSLLFMTQNTWSLSYVFHYNEQGTCMDKSRIFLTRYHSLVVSFHSTSFTHYNQTITREEIFEYLNLV